MNITAIKYHKGMSEKLDQILYPADIRKAWVVRDDQNASHIVIAESEEDAINRYEDLLKARTIPTSPREPRIGRPQKVKP